MVVLEVPPAGEAVPAEIMVVVESPVAVEEAPAAPPRVVPTIVADARAYCRTCMEQHSDPANNFTNFVQVPLIAEMIVSCTAIQVR